ncbi:uncharacterized protein LOC122317343 [Carya illinoinensis]|uniref:PB1 domain-containing protein n=1 Tax=Carya illinoinensis TaxID=32201 RepID=A0A8T1Q5W4_CARIL|nr:uncharacterized protein LOC122317343 [Carya illinoinensis]KAG6648660.1 hypothetical protein CIPAW_07G161700 [Carya illinoinensis]
MDNYSYSSYPDSGNSSPRSREIECETPSWDEPSTPASVHYKVKFMCSYGGKIQPRPYDNQLAYVGGETKILAVDRTVKFSTIKSKLSSLIPDADAVCFKYQLPGEDLDALISVTNDEDLEHMMLEYDRLYRASAKPARLRLFLFNVNNSVLTPATDPTSFGSANLQQQQQTKSERQWFVDALNSVQIDGSSPPANPDFLSGLDKGLLPATKLQDSAPVPTVPDALTKDVSAGSDCGSEDRHQIGEPAVSPTAIQRQFQDLQRLHIAANYEQNIFQIKSDEGNPRAYATEYYPQKAPEKMVPAATALPVPVQVPISATYMPERHMTTGGYHPVVASGADHHQPVYLIPTPTGVYQAVRPVGHAYYGVQRVVSEAYREQPVYNAATQQQPMTVGGAYGAEGSIQVVQQQQQQAETGYAQVGFDSAGRQVYYTTQGGVLPSYQTVVVDARQGGGGAVLNQEGKVVAKTSAA